MQLFSVKRKTCREAWIKIGPTEGYNTEGKVVAAVFEKQQTCKGIFHVTCTAPALQPRLHTPM